MPSQLSAQTIATVKATVPALEAHGLEITMAMYARIFQDPMVRDLFNQSHHGDTGSQPRALADAILAYAQNIDNLGVLGAAVERIAQKHVGLQILPEYYPYVAEALLGAIKDVLGDVASEPVLAAWGEAYWFLADILIAREAAVYQAIADADGGWTGWRDFLVEAKIRESEVITSFVLRPLDGNPVLAHKPGQYLTFWLELPGERPQKRNYSISAASNGETYRISVKREPVGSASNWLHDAAEVGTLLKVSAPAGEFFLGHEPERPVVLVSGGVGLTPMIAMLETLTRTGLNVPVHYVHGALNGATHAMRDHVRDLVSSTASVDATTFYLEPRSEDVRGRDFDEVGAISLDWLKANTPVAEADYYLCGPKGFLRTFVNGLALAGVAQDRIHYEFFGPADELLAA